MEVWENSTVADFPLPPVITGGYPTPRSAELELDPIFTSKYWDPNVKPPSVQFADCFL